jgi:hypothetical protein
MPRSLVKKLATTIKDRFGAVVRGMTDHRSNAQGIGRYSWTLIA